ncbi:MAG: septum formation initiator family protein [Alphaproteobacteria bacterium]|nr:septum formation initiator family protein [Alphaproteobacteria bacterium]
MDERLTLRRVTRGWSFPLLVLALVGYFSYFAVFGNHGLLRWSRLQAAVEAKQAELQKLSAERVALERRVSLMRPESVDEDMLEEQARSRLGLTEADEVVILK